MRERGDDAARSRAARPVYPAPERTERTRMHRHGPGRPSPATRGALRVERGAQRASARRANTKPKRRTSAVRQRSDKQPVHSRHVAACRAGRRAVRRAVSSRTSAIVPDVRSPLNPANASGDATGEARSQWSRSGPCTLPHQDFAALALRCAGSSGASSFWRSLGERTQENAADNRTAFEPEPAEEADGTGTRRSWGRPASRA